MKIFLSIAVIYCLIKTIESWDADDLALFDVVEDVGKNFYELLDIDQSATSAEIRRAYRKVSLTLHPDKNKDPDADNQFRRLVAAYEILKDEQMRLKYNELLVTGLPDWRQPVYYYRKVKKMGLFESSILLSIILTVGHFLVSWTIYLEKKFVYEELNKSKRKKDKKSRKQKSEDTEIDSTSTEVEQLIPKPKFSDLLPFLMFRGFVYVVSTSPSLLLQFVNSIKSSSGKNDEGDDDNVDTEITRARIPRPVNNFTYELAEPTASSIKLSEVCTNNEDSGKMESVLQRTGEWTESEIELLVKSIVKFPGGTMDRWEKISATVGRSVKEVTNMSKKLKSNNTQAMSEMNNKVLTKRAVGLKNIEHTTSELERDEIKNQSPKPQPINPSIVNQSSKPQPINPSIVNRNPEKTSTISGVAPQSKGTTPTANATTSWTQQQQKLLEAAMTQISKDDPERWDRIAGLVSVKSKEECLQRVRYLAEVVKKRKLEQQKTQTSTVQSSN